MESAYGSFKRPHCIVTVTIQLHTVLPCCVYNSVAFLTCVVLVAENVIDSLINVGWRPFLPIVKPLIDDLVSTAFTDIFDKYFQNFPFQEIFTQWPAEGVTISRFGLSALLTDGTPFGNTRKVSCQYILFSYTLQCVVGLHYTELSMYAIRKHCLSYLTKCET